MRIWQIMSAILSSVVRKPTHGARRPEEIDFKHATAVLFFLLCSLTSAEAQRRCEACMREGLAVASQTWSYDRYDRGAMYFTFRNAGNFNWTVEKVYCEFLDRQNRPLYTRSFDLDRFEVTARTQRRDSPRYLLQQASPDMKVSCWIESATR